MKKIDLGQAIQILANIGVIAGIVFLGVELHQNNALLETQASQARFESERERRTRLMTNAGGLLEATLKNERGEELTPLEQAQVLLQGVDLFDAWQHQYRQYLAGRLSLADMRVQAWRGLYEANEAVRANYERLKGGMDPGFVDFFESRVVER